ncbi:MAG TPA: ABC transporter ATP-binding protein [Xanthobacteraceae bacterium]|nr:ABC transporter ATP-binding protein [Xanthobacteraceae bacterium]
MIEGPLRVSQRNGAAPPLLEIADVTIRFGGIVALEAVNFSVREGRIVGLIGPNGAGKTTLFNCLSRLYRPLRGDVRLKGQSLGRCAPSDIAALGISRTFQSPALFASMSVLDNVKVGAHARGRKGPLNDALTLPSSRREEHEFEQTARAMLAFVGLDHAAGLPAAILTLGARKRVELARALAAHPLLLLLDEPAGGLNHDEVAELGTLIRAIRDQLGITVLLVEHHMGLVMGLSDQVVVLNFGRVIADGPPDQVRANPAVTEAYLGTRRH